MILDVRDRMTEGVNRARLRLEARRAVSPLVVVIAGLLVAALGGTWLITHTVATFLRGTYEVRVAVRDAYGVQPGVDRARYRGVEAGAITGLEREGDQVIVVAEIDKRYGPIYRDAKAELRPQTPLNDMYLDIVDPGTEAAGELEGVLPEAQTETAVRIDEVLHTLQADERARLRALLDNLGNGLEDGGRRLRTAVAELTPLVRAAGRLTDQLAARRKATRRLVHNLAILTEELGRRDAQLRRLVRDGSAALGTLQAGSADLDATLRLLPPAVSELLASFSRVRGVLGDVDAAVDELMPVADRLPAALESVRALDADLSGVVRDLRDPVRRLVPLSDALRPVARSADRALAALRPLVPAIDKTTDGVVRCRYGIRGFFQWNASLSKFGDARGPIPRGNLAVGVPDTGLPGLARRLPGRNCVPGTTIGGRVPRPEDEQ